MAPKQPTKKQRKATQVANLKESQDKERERKAILTAKKELDAMRSGTRRGTDILRNGQQPLWLGAHNIAIGCCIDNALRQAAGELDMSTDDQLHIREIFYSHLVIAIPSFIRDP